MQRKYINPRATALERTILRNLANGNLPALRAVETIALDHRMPATAARAQAASRYLGGRSRDR